MDVPTRARAYAAATPVAISGSAGHKQTFALACALTHGFGLDERTALEILCEWNVGCMPPWSVRDLRHKVDQSQKVSHQKERGHLLGDCLPAYPVRQFVAPKAEKSVWKIARRQLEPPAKQPSEPSESLFGLIFVPGCQIGRPAEIERADADWLAAEKSGLLGEPIIQAALQMFGPGCTVVSNDPAEVAP